MGRDCDWAEQRQAIMDWDEKANGPLIHLRNFYMFVAVQTATTWEQLQQWLGILRNEHWVFRGQRRAEWRLTTSLERATLKSFNGFTAHLDPAEAEQHLLFEFKRRSHHYLSSLPEDTQILDWLALMQHYGAPTRLLDWTQSPYVGLYFALEVAEAECDHALWAIDLHWLNETFERELNQRYSCSPPTDSRIRTYEHLNRVLLDDDRPNRSGIVIANPLRVDERMAVQQGVFLCNLSHTEQFDVSLLHMVAQPTRPEKPVLRKLLLPPQTRTPLLRELSYMNVNAASLFPGLDGFSRSLCVDLDIQLERTRARLSRAPASGDL